MRQSIFKQKVLAAVLTIAALAVGQTAWATTTWTVTNADNVFTITCSESGAAETVKYHTVSLSAMAGKHFTAVSGTLEFAADETSKTVTVAETAKDDVNILYRFQTVMSRSYRLEVTNTNGYLLAYRDRIIEFGDDYRYKTRYLNNSLENLVIFNQNGEFSTINENDIVSYLMNKVNKYIDVSYDPSTNTEHEKSGDYIKIDDGYDYSRQRHQCADLCGRHRCHGRHQTADYRSEWRRGRHGRQRVHRYQIPLEGFRRVCLH